MDFFRLKALREISLRGSVAGAAEALFLTPSAVSQQVTQLEEELGISLTERRGRGLRLTKAGEVLVVYAERVMGLLDEAKSELSGMKAQVVGNLRLAALPSVAAAVLPLAVKQLNAQHPQLSILVEELPSAEGIAAIRSWHSDLAIVDDIALVGNEGNFLESIPFAADTLIVLVSTSHPLAKRDAVRIKDLSAEFWAMDAAYGSYGDYILRVCRQAGLEPNVIAKCRSFEMVSSMVASGNAISLVPRLRMANRPKGVTAVRVIPEVKRKISIAYRRGERKHPAIRAVLAQLLASHSRLQKMLDMS